MTTFTTKASPPNLQQSTRDIMRQIWKWPLDTGWTITMRHTHTHTHTHTHLLRTHTQTHTCTHIYRHACAHSLHLPLSWNRSRGWWVHTVVFNKATTELGSSEWTEWLTVSPLGIACVVCWSLCVCVFVGFRVSITGVYSGTFCHLIVSLSPCVVSEWTLFCLDPKGEMLKWVSVDKQTSSLWCMKRGGNWGLCSSEIINRHRTPTTNA